MLTTCSPFKTVTASITKYLPDHDKSAPYWPRVNNSLERLAKRISKKGKLKELKKTLKEKRQGGDEVGECIIVTRLDPNKKAYDPLDEHTHLHSVRVFRFHWLNEADDLKSAEECSNGFNEKLNEEFCINPYHYETRRWEKKTKQIRKPLATWTQYRDRANTFIPNKDLDTKNRLVLKWDTDGVLIRESRPSYNLNPAYNRGLKEEEYAVTDVWAAVKLNPALTKISKEFTSISSQFIVDASSEERSTSERLSFPRPSSKVGKGVLIYTVDGEVYLKNLSESPIFILSLFANHFFRYESTAVVKIPSKASLKVWSNDEFLDLLEAQSENSFHEVEDLGSWGNIRISFVGWGQKYEHQKFPVGLSSFEVTFIDGKEWAEKTMLAMGKPDLAAG